MSEALSLCVVPPEEYLQFADALREFLPHSYQIEAMLRGHAKYDYFGIFDAQLYAPLDLVHRHHLAVISPSGSTREIDSFSIYWNEHHLSDDSVCQLLQSLPVIHWDKPVMVRQMPLHLQPKMDSITTKLSNGELHLFSPIPAVTMILTPENIRPVPKLPQGYYFGTLDGSYAEEILLPWIGAPTETVKGMAQFLDKLPSVAIFHSKQRNGAPQGITTNVGHEDELVCRCVYKHGSDLGMTYTKDDHRRKGLASAATLMAARKVQEDGLLTSVIIDFDYKVSQKMHKSIGFTHYCDIAVPFYFPKHFDFDSILAMSNFINGFPDSMKKWHETHAKN